jgi:hypothetical protein
MTTENQPKRIYIIPYTYKVLAYAHVEASSIDEAIELTEKDAPGFEPDDFEGENEIKKVYFEELGNSFKVLKHEIRDHNDLK